MSKARTSDQILQTARDILATEGLGAVSFDTIARRLGRSKQAVLYWFPTKQDLLAAMFVPWLVAEEQAATQALAGVRGRAAAIAAFVRAVAAFHFDDLDRFRMMYLVPQTLKPAAPNRQSAAVLEQVHPVTDRMYSALAAHLNGAHPRQEAVAIHAAVLGLALLAGLAQSLRDPLKHGEAELIDALIARLTGGESGVPG
ncbi:TetR/AcrR family transcriptional regulator [Sinisalibacter aestuarii]|uniref:HTH tetR-type domain-containing protein n=1 Tax=Sinisalibacter aestuarii TaxID=2949426 RepID=A0ABQ5LU07_9RHOB|nr:TetR/AcrR family transcriptional regulator [Sinisalibacter aestuarii]GKY88460.1 hypothetical protein STA1M1_23290 [Sinisalibacter aestuarii]